jgi:hypothetical protein
MCVCLGGGPLICNVDVSRGRRHLHSLMASAGPPPRVPRNAVFQLLQVLHAQPVGLACGGAVVELLLNSLNNDGMSRAARAMHYTSKSGVGMLDQRME